MVKINDVEVTLESVTKEDCKRGYKVGDIWLVKGGNTPEREMCASAYISIAPAIRVLSMGSDHPWDSEKGVTHAMCPDPNVGLVFRIRRLE